jgi:hypothetical protein
MFLRILSTSISAAWGQAAFQELGNVSVLPTTRVKQRLIMLAHDEVSGKGSPT